MYLVINIRIFKSNRFLCDFSITLTHCALERMSCENSGKERAEVGAWLGAYFVRSLSLTHSVRVSKLSKIL